MRTLVSPCPLEEAMQVIGGRWPTLLVYYLKDGSRRFAELRRDNPSISHKMLSFELRRLEAAAIVLRTEHAGYPSRVDYELTETGRELLAILDSLGDWWERSAPLNAPVEAVAEAQ